MKFFNKSKKEYDGPAVSAPATTFRRHSTDCIDGSTNGNGNNVNVKRVPGKVISKNGIAWSVSSSVTSTDKYTRRGSDLTSSKSSDTGTMSRRSSDCGSKPSKSHKPVDRTQPLAPGISTRRHSKPVSKHLAANKMTGNKLSANLHPITGSTNGTNSNNTSSNDEYKSIPKTPMHHDGGITTLLPLPTHSNTHRFLSGSVDGTIQLWHVIDNSIKHRDKDTLTPQWVRTYKGHRGYIRQLSRLGYFNAEDGKTKELFVSASQDNTLRIWEIDNSDIQSTSTNSNTKNKGKKLRGHTFSSISSSGVLCVTSVPSLSSSGISFTADQFVSGGSDGCLRVWDVRTALSLEKVPKSGMYSTVQVQVLEKDRISVLKDADESDSESSVEEDENGEKKKDKKKKDKKKKSQAVPITTIVCTGKTLDTVALFAADALGTIRRYSPKNRGVGLNNSIWWEFTGYFSSGGTSVNCLTVLTSPDLASLVYDNEEKQSVTLLAAASSGSIRVWDGADVLMKQKLDESDTAYSHIDKKKMKREALWKIQLNEEHSDNEESTTKSTSVVNKKPIGITSLSTIQSKRLIAGTDNGKIHIWDVSTGSYEGSYSFGKGIQIWSTAVISATEYKSGNEVTTVGIIVSGDHRGRIRALKNVIVGYGEDEYGDGGSEYGRDSLHSYESSRG